MSIAKKIPPKKIINAFLQGTKFGLIESKQNNVFSSLHI